MYDRFRWSGVSKRRNMTMLEYEPVQPYFLLALAERAGCKTFLDIGSNIGAYAVFASLIPTVERIVAFEANPHAAKEIQANSELNRLSIEVVKKAVSRKAGMTSFGLTSRYSGRNGIDNEVDEHARIIVETIALDSLGLAGPLCFKIDVEGHEKAVIEGAVKTLEQPCVIQMEGYQDEAAQLVTSLGYSRLTRIGPDDYFSNLALNAVEIYEVAVARMIDDNHRAKAVTVKHGDFALTITGGSAGIARGAAMRMLGHRL